MLQCNATIHAIGSSYSDSATVIYYNIATMTSSMSAYAIGFTLWCKCSVCVSVASFLTSLHSYFKCKHDV